jgi:hypothetical protein
MSAELVGGEPRCCACGRRASDCARTDATAFDDSGCARARGGAVGGSGISFWICASCTRSAVAGWVRWAARVGPKERA